MTNHDHTANSHDQDSENCAVNPVLRRGRWILIAFGAIAAFFLLSEHRAHVLGLLPFAFLLACPLMHLFMHGGHGGHGGHSHDSGASRSTSGNDHDGKDWT